MVPDRARPEGSLDPLTYRVTRFRSLRKLDAIADVPDDFDLRASFGDASAVYRGARNYDVELRFVPEAAALVTETKWHHTQKAEHQADGSVTLAFRVNSLEEIAPLAPRLVGVGRDPPPRRIADPGRRVPEPGLGS